MNGRFRMMFLQCAQECAQPIVTIDVFRIVELLASQDVIIKATVFQKHAFEIRLHQENSPDPQVLAWRIVRDLR